MLSGVLMLPKSDASMAWLLVKLSILLTLSLTILGVEALDVLSNMLPNIFLRLVTDGGEKLPVELVGVFACATRTGASLDCSVKASPGGIDEGAELLVLLLTPTEDIEVSGGETDIPIELAVFVGATTLANNGFPVMSVGIGGGAGNCCALNGTP